VLTQLEELFLNNNLLTEIPKELCELQNLNELHIDTNDITQLPIEIINLENLDYFRVYDNPIENLLNPLIQRFLARFENRTANNFYNDTQNIHSSSIQQSIKDSIYRLLQQLKDNNDYNYIDDTVLSSICKEAIIEYANDTDVHSQLQCNFSDILKAVFHEINQMTPEMQELAKQRLNEEMVDSICKCFTGRITRLVNCLSGISDKVVIKISSSEEIGNIISIARVKFTDIDEIKEYATKELKERGYTDDVIIQWIEYIE
jgi:hypothetical protein